MEQEKTCQEVVIQWKSVAQSKLDLYDEQLKSKLEQKKFSHEFASTARALGNIDDLRQYYMQRRTAENAMFFLSLIGIVLMVVENVHQDLYSLRYMNVGITIMTVFSLGYRYHAQHKIDVSRHIIPSGLSFIQRPRLVLRFVLEFIICAFVVPPGATSSFQIKEWRGYVDENGGCSMGKPQGKNCVLAYAYEYRVLGVFMLLKLYMLPRFVRNNSGFYSHRIAFIGAVHNVDSLSPLFAIKCFLRSNPFLILIPGFFLTWVLISYVILIVERPVNPKLSSLSNTLWLTVITMSTVGYGDRSPITIFGRVVMFFGGILAGILLISMLSASFFAMLELSEKDERILHVLAEQNWQKEMNHAAARLIQSAWNLRKCCLHDKKTNDDASHAGYYLLYCCAARVQLLRHTRPVNNLSLSLALHNVYEDTLGQLQLHHKQKMRRMQAMNYHLAAIIQRNDKVITEVKKEATTL